jgi:hypothetical protein
MGTRLSPPQIEQLKRRAKELRRADESLSQSAALNHVARENGWTNWALLARNSLLAPDDLLTLDCQRYPDGMEGVLLVDMAIVDLELRKALAGDSLCFTLPVQRGWLFRRADPQPHEVMPHIDLRQGDPRGIFVNDSWRAILSINGIQPPEIRAHMAATLPGLLRDLKASAFAALLPYIASTAPTAGGQVRLFFSRPGENGLPEVAERTYATVAEAKAAEFPDDWVRIGIPLSDGKWLTHQLPFGWSA